jgi:hypothetical protein
MTLWSRGVARRAMMGYEPTHNPTPSAASLLGKGRVKRAGAVLKRKGIKRRHKGNPLPAVVALVGGKLPGIKNLFKTPSEKRAAGPAQTLVNAAVQGNLTAAKAIAERTEIGIQKERAIWRKAALQIPPKIMQLLQKYQEQVPGVDHSTPEAAADSALARAVNANDLEAKEAAAAAEVRAAAGRRSAAADAKQARREELLAGVGGQIGSALLSRGRSLRQPRRKRRRIPRF